MSFLKHECDAVGCKLTPNDCYCPDHIEQIRKEAFDEGFEEGKQFVRE